jgi:hypothetical protein
MAWQDILIPMVRNLIGDLSDTPTYEDERIEQAIVTAGLIVSQEYPFQTTYTFDFSTPDLIPDPTETDTLDNAAVALFSLKAACILSMNSYQLAVGRGIRVRDGDSEVDTTGSFKGYADIIANGPCASYTKLLLSLSTKRGMNLGKAVVSPSSSGDQWGNRGYNGIWHIRSFWDSWASW